VIEPTGLVVRLVAGAPAGRRDDALFGAFCDELLAAGVPLLRTAMGAEFLHPTYNVRQLRWMRGAGAHGRTSERDPDGAHWLNKPNNPPDYLAKRDLRTLRRRIEPASIAEFPILVH
jgi:adenylate cyclase